MVLLPHSSLVNEPVSADSELEGLSLASSLASPSLSLPHAVRARESVAAPAITLSQEAVVDRFTS